VILGIDTATRVCSVALVHERRVIAEAVGGAPSGPRPDGRRPDHAATLMPSIEYLLSRAGCGLDELTGIVLTLGPGSFTGLRIGLSTVKGLAYGSGIPVAGISTLLALAARVDDWRGRICAWLDARKGEVYAGLFERRDTTLYRLRPDTVAPPGRVLRDLAAERGPQPWLFLGEGAQVYRDLILSAVPDGRFAAEELYPSIAAAAALLVEAGSTEAIRAPLESLAPIYLRRSEAELKVRAQP
jgi:tRNA threonylcarbamoyladenosine biosynthesis protein TsaB